MNTAGIGFFQRLSDYIGNNAEAIKILLAVFGGGFALYQWSIQIMHKRAELVRELLRKAWEDADIAAIMDIIDWNDGLEYDGKFRLGPNVKRQMFANMSDDDLFVKVDKTLAHFSHICYLKERRAIAGRDLSVFRLRP